MAETTRTTTIARREFSLGARQVERALRGVLPEPVRDHFVVVNGRRYPPKQALGRVTGLDRADFTTHHARRILTNLGFPAGRRQGVAAPSAGDASASGPPRRRPAISGTRPTPETLEPFIGQWVATKGEEVLVAASEPRTVVGWLAEHGRQADSMFRVPGSGFEASGLAPL